MEWNKDSIITLINLYKSKELLWNPNNDDYKNRHKRYSALSDIAYKFATTPTEVERKIKNVSCHYFREKKKVDESKSGSDKEDSYKSKWFAYNYLNFLGSRREEKEMTRKKKLREKFSESKRVNSPNCMSEPQVLLNGIDETSSDSILGLSESFPQAKKHFLNKDQNYELVTEFVKVLRNLPNKCGKDEDALFGDYIAGQLRKMDKSLKAVVRNRINNIIYEAESGCVTLSSLANADFLLGQSFNNSATTADTAQHSAKDDETHDTPFLVDFRPKTEPNGSF